MIRLFVHDRNTSNTAVQYTRNTKKEKNYINATFEKCLNKHLSICHALGLIKCNINFFKKLLTVFLITKHFRQHHKNRVLEKYNF